MADLDTGWAAVAHALTVIGEDRAASDVRRLRKALALQGWTLAPIPPTKPTEPDDNRPYMDTYRDFWADLVETGGQLDLDKVARELSDYSRFMHDTAIVYDHVTGGRISKPNTRAFAVTAEADDFYERLYAEVSTDG